MTQPSSHRIPQNSHSSLRVTSRRFLPASLLLALVLIASLWPANRESSPKNCPTPSPLHCSRPTTTGTAPRFRLVPEYDRRASRVVVSLPSDETTPDLHDEVLGHLPRYSQIQFLVPEERYETLRKWAASRVFGDQVTFVTYNPHYHRRARLYLLLPDEDQLVAVDTGDFSVGTQHGTVWAQDLFEVTRNPIGQIRVLASCVHKCYQGLENRSSFKVASDNTYLDRLENQATTIRHLDLAFKGGNVLTDSRNGATIALLGYDTIRSTRTVWAGLHGERLSDSEIVARYRDALGVDQVSIVGPRRTQPRLLYHLDQALLLLPHSTAAIARLIGEIPPLEPDASQVRAVQAFLAETRDTLRRQGYSLIDVDTPVANVLRYQHYVNAIPYVDTETNQRTLLMPVFPETDSEPVVLANVERFQAIGYRVVPVPTNTYRFTGGIHCLVNVLE